MRLPPVPPLRGVIVFTLIALLLASAAAAQKRPAKEPWKAPARAARKANPHAADAASLKAGKAVYNAECADCHGRSGAGDGPGARDLKSAVPPLTRPEVWRQSDGELFWKLSTGRGDMPGFDDMLSDDERWHAVNYARATFAPKTGNGEGAEVAGERQHAGAPRAEGKR